MLQANKMMAIGELAAGIAHEIRNPLGIIRNHSFILRSYSNTNINKSLDYIDNAVRRASRIIDNILNFSRISGDTEEFVNIGEFIHNILELQVKNLQKQGISYKVECINNYKFLINQESLKHILINLLSNAMDAIEENGEIIVKAYEYDEGILIEFIDNGIGINAENIEKIFNPFYTSKEPGKGTGLGLYITYNEVKKLKGDISIESKLGFGTKFKVYLPAGGNSNEGSI
ncbi:sensor histidine kinase [Tissierella sp. P1]|uniref:sensor histidine kinase n=1 Tax=Tissierella sp. P1 TaxID=1280483 RepID=UPI00130345C0|nr:HAMP domain-containing sensor histidine kinase [Tissierella sp. P1]